MGDGKMTVSLDREGLPDEQVLLNEGCKLKLFVLFLLLLHSFSMTKWEWWYLNHISQSSCWPLVVEEQLFQLPLEDRPCLDIHTGTGEL